MRFVEQVAARPEFVGAGYVGADDHLIVTVYGDPSTIEAMAKSMLPPGTRYEIVLLDHGLPELQALADRIVAVEMAPDTRNDNVILVDVDELRGVVVIGVEQADDVSINELTLLYGPLVVIEQVPPGRLLPSSG
jgi:hypothetical protein